MSELYADAMSMFEKCGLPELFITFAANPHWEEFTENEVQCLGWRCRCEETLLMFIAQNSKTWNSPCTHFSSFRS